MSTTSEQSQEQSKLLSAIFNADSSQTRFNSKGLEVYRRNLQANANRALGISFPVTAQLLGDELFQLVVQEYLKASPPYKGDWGEWGDTLADWLAQQDIADQYPFIPDCAALEWLHHQCERADNFPLQLESFQLLNDEKASEGRLLYNPTLKTLRSDYPIFDIWMAHTAANTTDSKTTEESEAAQWMQSTKQKLADGEGQTVLIWRNNWKANVRLLSPIEHQWYELLRSELSLEKAFDELRANNSLTDFSFEQWLPNAIAEHSIIGFALRS